MKDRFQLIEYHFQFISVRNETEVDDEWGPDSDDIDQASVSAPPINLPNVEAENKMKEGDDDT